jgi:polysaccharide pyruvyl transferase WcaK-like protein
LALFSNDNDSGVAVARVEPGNDNNAGVPFLKAKKTKKNRAQGHRSCADQFRLKASSLLIAPRGNMNEREKKQKKIAFFGHFDSTNFGNESTLKAILYNLRRFQPDAEVTCISTGPAATAATHHIKAIPIAETFLESWVPRNPVGRVLRSVCIGLPSELYRWVVGLMKLRRTDMLIVPGTGLLTDAYGLLGWGPYNLFKWALIAKACHCKLLFVSIGAGPIYGTLGRYFIKSILSLADFRSYRDNSTMQYLEGIGLRAGDRVYPDLAFSLPDAVIPRQDAKKSGRSVVGLGVMAYAGRYSVSRPSDATHLAYLDNLVTVVKWLLSREYDVRLLIGDRADMPALQAFKDLLRERLSVCDEGHIIDEPIYSVEDLISQIVATDIIVATRFHNILLASLCNKPVIAISFHHKCGSLMSALGLSEYCLDINDLRADRLIEKFCDLERNVDKIELLIREKAKEFRKSLDEQYKFIFNEI